MRVVLGCDKAGTEWLPVISEKLTAMGIENEILYDGTVDGCDYPEAAFMVAEAVSEGKADKGILVCGTGIGMSIAANKHKGIRAACCSDTFSARMTRMHNDANVLCLGGRVVGAGLALDMVKLFVETEFEGGGRHTERVALLTAIENEQ